MKPNIEVIVPLWNEESIVEELYKNISSSLSTISIDYQITLVNDGSCDKTSDILEKIRISDSKVKVIHFIRNFGQHAAIMAALSDSIANYVVVMDGDMQDDPKVILDLYRKTLEGWPVVYVERVNRSTGPLYGLLQKTFYLILNKISDLEFNSRYGNFSIINNEVLKSYQALNESISYYPAALRWLNFKSTSIPVPQRERYSGTKTKYNIKTRAKLAIDVILSNSQKPLQMATLLGLFFAVGSSCFGMFAIYSHFVFHKTTSGWTSLMTAVCLFFGIQMILMGILGLYVGNISKRSMSRPKFIKSR